MADTRALTLRASTEALRLRQYLGIGLTDSLCVYDVAEHLGIEVWFWDVGTSFEGMYRRGVPPHIVVSSLRPPGRQASTCAHELGHHVFGHGTHVDDATADPARQTGFQVEEYLADAFSAMLLMPKSSVCHAFQVRGWSVEAPTSEHVYRVASWLGVGYTTLINHMDRTLRIFKAGHAAALRKREPQTIRAALLENGTLTGHLVVVDTHWAERAVDLSVQDCALVPAGIRVEGTNVVAEGSVGCGLVLRAVAPGMCRICHPPTGWAAYVRVSRAGYVGRNLFRHLEDPDDETVNNE